MNEERSRISKKGRQRHQEMLTELQQAMRDFHRRRRRRRWAVTVSAFLGCFVAVVILILPTNDTHQLSDISGEKTPRVDESSDQVRGFQRYVVTTEVGIHQKYIIRDDEISKPHVDLLSDSELLSILAEHGKEGFLATIGDKRVFVAKSGS